MPQHNHHNQRSTTTTSGISAQHHHFSSSSSGASSDSTSNLPVLRLQFINGSNNNVELSSTSSLLLRRNAGKMTCRTPSSASSRSTGSTSSGISSLSSAGSTCSTASSASSAAAAAAAAGSSCCAEWQQSVSIREIYKTGRLSLLVDKKGIFWRHEQLEQPYWCVFCIHEESAAFLELYEDHKSSLSHQPLRTISLADCQHVSPNISHLDDKHSFTITRAHEVHQLGAASQADMHDWIATLRSRLHDLQGLEADHNNTYTRCPQPVKPSSQVSQISSTTTTAEPLFVELPPIPEQRLLQNREPTRTSSTEPPRTTSRSPLPQRPLALITKRPLERRPSPLPSSIPATPETEPLASPPACEAPPVPTTMSNLVTMTTPPPPVPPRGIRPMRPVPHPLVTGLIPPPPPPRTGEEPTTLNDGKPPRPPRKEDLRQSHPSNLTPSAAEVPLISLSDDEATPLRSTREPEPENVYGTLFQRKRSLSSPQMFGLAPSRTGTVANCPVSASVASAVKDRQKLETRSQTASPALSVDSVTSTVSEPAVAETSHLQPLPATDRTPVTAMAAPTSTPRHTSHTGRHHGHSMMATAAEQQQQQSTSTTLRQQQVERLKQEMADPSGVKVRVRRKDCQTALALVDCFGCVWIAGWKQKEHPHFHSLFHLGDQILSINGIYVAKSADVFRVLKDCPEKQHAVFNVNRVPRGQVFLLTRLYDGQDLGIIREGSTAEVRSVVSDGLAAQCGLPAKAITCDGGTLCSWVITEINHRPLNWFFKDNEVDDRLNAVGREMSILVQPLDLVNAIKKQLRTLRNYKDFILQ